MRAYFLFALLMCTLPIAGVLVWILQPILPTVARRVQRGIYALYAWALGLKTVVTGHVPPQGALLVCNHRSWCDIILLGSIWPLAFVAKSEVRQWPLIGWMASITGAVFVERERKSRAAQQANALAEALKQGRTVVIFAEGTSHDAPRCLPFKSALMAAIPEGTPVYPVALEYTHLRGLPVRPEQRPITSWIGEQGLTSSLQAMANAAPIACRVHVCDPVPAGYKRKELTAWCHTHINQSLEAIIDEPIKRF